MADSLKAKDKVENPKAHFDKPTAMVHPATIAAAPMSALGQKRKLRRDFIMSALIPTADIRAQRTIGQKVPSANSRIVK
jgi:hypothetical protein